MKKKLLFLCIVVLCFSLLTACSDESKIQRLWRRGLQHSNVDMRIKTLEKLTQFDNPLVIDALHDALNDENTQVRLLAVQKLCEYDIYNQKIIPPLTQAIHDESNEIRLLAASVLCRYEGIAVPTLQRMLEDKEESIRLLGVKKVQDIKNDEIIKIIDPLISLLSDSNEKISSIAIDILSKANDPQAIDIMLTSIDAKTPNTHLLMILFDKDPNVVLKVIDMIPQIVEADETILPVLKPQLYFAFKHNQSDELREKAIDTFLTYSNPEDIDRLINVLDSKNNYVRLQAKNALIDMSNQGIDVFTPLTDYFKDGSLRNGTKIVGAILRELYNNQSIALEQLVACACDLTIKEDVRLNFIDLALSFVSTDESLLDDIIDQILTNGPDKETSCLTIRLFPADDEIKINALNTILDHYEIALQNNRDKAQYLIESYRSCGGFAHTQQMYDGKLNDLFTPSISSNLDDAYQRFIVIEKHGDHHILDHVFFDIPFDARAYKPEQARYVIALSRDRHNTGTYTDKTIAYRTDTIVQIIDKATGSILSTETIWGIAPSLKITSTKGSSDPGPDWNGINDYVKEQVTKLGETHKPR